MSKSLAIAQRDQGAEYVAPDHGANGAPVKVLSINPMLPFHSPLPHLKLLGSEYAELQRVSMVIRGGLGSKENSENVDKFAGRTCDPSTPGTATTRCSLARPTKPSPASSVASASPAIQRLGNLKEVGATLRSARMARPYLPDCRDLPGRGYAQDYPQA